MIIIKLTDNEHAIVVNTLRRCNFDVLADKIECVYQESDVETDKLRGMSPDTREKLNSLIWAYSYASGAKPGAIVFDALRIALNAYERTGDHDHGDGAAWCPGDCWVHKARKLLEEK